MLERVENREDQAFTHEHIMKRVSVFTTGDRIRSMASCHETHFTIADVHGGFCRIQAISRLFTEQT